MTCSNRRCNLSHSGSAGALSDFQQLNGPQCSVGFKGFVWLSASRWATFGCRPAFVWVMLQPSIKAREVTALHQHFCPPTSNAFCSCTVHLSPQLHTFRRKQKPGARRRKLELQVNQKVWKHVTLVKEISDTLLPCKHLHKKKNNLCGINTQNFIGCPKHSTNLACDTTIRPRFTWLMY